MRAEKYRNSNPDNNVDSAENGYNSYYGEWKESKLRRKPR